MIVIQDTPDYMFCIYTVEEEEKVSIISHPSSIFFSLSFFKYFRKFVVNDLNITITRTKEKEREKAGKKIGKLHTPFRKQSEKFL